jgi:hypothetical protein
VVYGGLLTTTVFYDVEAFTGDHKDADQLPTSQLEVHSSTIT